MSNNLPSGSGSNIVPSQPPKENSLQRVLKMLVRPAGFFIALAGLIGIGVLVTNTAAQSVKKDTTPTIVAVKPTATVKAGAAPTATVSPSPTPDGIIKVFITGEIKKPGVYTMQDGDRVIDAVKLAGGFTTVADQERVDQAQRVKDEMRIEIPAKPPTSLPTATALPGQTPVAGAVSTVVPNEVPSATATPSDSRINVNTASAADLDKLPGIGEVLSQRIVDYRTKNGVFHSLDDLRKVQGITASVIEKIKDLIVFN